MTQCDCDTTPFGGHAPDCALVKLRMRPRIDCAGPCQRDDAPQATAEEFRRIDYCADCEESYESPDPDGEDFRGGEAAAFMAAQMADWQKLK